MKKTILILILVTFIIPLTGYAAPLTNQQSVSLINVVKSSPSTPASAFVGLITAFSSITNTQAESLITVIQAAPEAPADAFVNLLMSFTVDPVVLGGTIQPVIPPNPTPVTNPPIVEVDHSDMVVTLNSSETATQNGSPFGEWVYKVVLHDKKGNIVSGANVHLDAPNDNINPWFDETLNRASENALFSYIPTTAGTKTLTFTSGSLSKTVTIVVE